ncbi:hypothetical protein EDB84DRAFT_1443927, partial [Lactarius hengduanensis]
TLAQHAHIDIDICLSWHPPHRRPNPAVAIPVVPAAVPLCRASSPAASRGRGSRRGSGRGRASSRGRLAPWSCRGRAIVAPHLRAIGGHHKKKGLAEAESAAWESIAFAHRPPPLLQGQHCGHAILHTTTPCPLAPTPPATAGLRPLKDTPKSPWLPPPPLSSTQPVAAASNPSPRTSSPPPPPLTARKSRRNATATPPAAAGLRPLKEIPKSPWPPPLSSTQPVAAASNPSPRTSSPPPPPLTARKSRRNATATRRATPTATTPTTTVTRWREQHRGRNDGDAAAGNSTEAGTTVMPARPTMMATACSHLMCISLVKIEISFIGST